MDALHAVWWKGKYADQYALPIHLYALQIFNAFLWTNPPLVLLVSRALWETDIAKIVSILLKAPSLLFSEKVKIGFRLQNPGST